MAYTIGKPTIGIGVTTYKRKHLLKECLDNIHKFTERPFKIYVAEDTDADRRGIALRKNECLEHLKDCDYVFLFDDDCYPKRSGWTEMLIEKHKATNVHHFLLIDYKNHDLKNYLFINGETLTTHNKAGGVMMFLTKEAIEKVGGFYTEYDTYGYEHLGYSCRVYEAKLTPDYFVSFEEMNEYFFSHDYDNEGFLFNKSTITNKERDRFADVNKPIFAQDVTQVYRPIICQKDQRQS